VIHNKRRLVSTDDWKLDLGQVSSMAWTFPMSKTLDSIPSAVPTPLWYYQHEFLLQRFICSTTCFFWLAFFASLTFTTFLKSNQSISFAGHRHFDTHVKQHLPYLWFVAMLFFFRSCEILSLSSFQLKDTKCLALLQCSWIFCSFILSLFGCCNCHGRCVVVWLRHAVTAF